MTIENIKQLIISNFPLQPTQDQIKAIELLSKFIFNFEDPNIFILKGYAGTGKTTLVSVLENILPKLKIKTNLLAPTGRAAKVFASYANKNASTIHRKIYKIVNDKNGQTKIFLSQNKHTNTIFIVDEASMISYSNKNNEVFGSRIVLDDLVEYIYSGVNCKLLLVGDTAQLPPVGSDYSPAIDINFINKNYGFNIINYELKEVVRQQTNSGILANATYLRKQIELNKITGKFFKTTGFDDIIKISSNDLEECLNEAYSKYSKEEIVVITRSNKRANQFNQEIRKRIFFKDDDISIDDYLMVVKNNYFWLDENSEAGFIANGDIIVANRIKNVENIHNFNFADLQFSLCDYPNHQLVEAKILTDTIDLETPSLSFDDSNLLYKAISNDYNDIKSKAKRYAAIKKDPYFNAIQVKYAYSLTCHKTQGGQWKVIFIDQGYLTKEMINIEFLRWLYTAITRATDKVYLVNFKDEYFIQ